MESRDRRNGMFGNGERISSLLTEGALVLIAMIVFSLITFALVAAFAMQQPVGMLH